jgi:glucose/arabinose dehydrogenase
MKKILRIMKNFIFLVPVMMLVFDAGCNGYQSQKISTPAAAVRIIKNDLNYPWEIIWGKDNHIWMTEREGTIRSIDPSTGKTLFSYKIDEAEANNEGGMLGMALHPDFLKNGFLYVVYDYRKNGVYTEKLVRFTYTGTTLKDPFVLIDNITANTNHDGSRLWITNEVQPKIFMTTGDAWDQSLPQNTKKLNGKVLRLNLDGSVPADNPFPNNPVWSYGHRNPQGLVMVNGTLYASEHGPSVDDEVNIIEKGVNYGWPDATGRPPIWSSGNSTLAVCGLDYYNHDLIPQWKNSLLMLTLKNSSIEQLQLSTDGRSIVKTNTFFSHQWGRLRDICISPAGKVYICTSNGGNEDVLVEISKL